MAINPLFAQIVSNDACTSAYNFGTMDDNVQECYAADNIGATAELPYINQGHCLGIDNVSSHAADVWFKFTAAGNLLDINITSALDTLMIALYEGNCDSLIGRKCEAISNGAINTTFAPVTTGQSYYLQISGGSISDVGDYNLCLTSYQVETDICIIDQTISLDPLPYLGSYLKNQTVHICLTIGGYFQNSAEWFDGLVPVFGDGWDVSTLQVFPPPSCDGTNAWEWYDSVTGTGSNSPGTVGPGFFYDLDNDGNPGNDFGDSGNCGWTFCMDITTKDCPPANNANDLSIEFLNYSDAEAGSWNSLESPCVNDPNYVMKALLTCCAIPTMSGISPTCLDPQSGSITATSGSEPPMIFAWSNGFSEISSGVSTITNIAIGFYSVTITDNNNCSQVAFFELKNNNINITTNTIQPSTTLQGNGTYSFAINGGMAPYTAILTNTTSNESFMQIITSSPPNATANFTGLVGGLYTLAVTDDGNCSNSSNFEIAYNPIISLQEMTQADEWIQINPNPATDVLHIIAQQNLSDVVTFSLYDATGKKITQHLFSNKTYNINIAHLPSNIYYYTAETQQKTYQHGKIVVLK